MSMNIEFEAHRTIIVKATGKEEVQSICFFEVWQTPTEVTYDIKDSADPIQSYKDWVLENSEDREEAVWDLLGEEIVGYETINYGKAHIEEFNEWIDKCQVNGYKIVATVV